MSLSGSEETAAGAHDEASVHSELLDDEDDDDIELDLSRTMTWTGKALALQPGTQFSMPLIVPYPAILAIQFETDGGDVDFSLVFTDDKEPVEQTLLAPVRASQRGAHLDIDTTGSCTLAWHNPGWVSTRTLTYQLQLAPKIDTRRRRWRNAAITAAVDFRMLSAVELAEQLDSDMHTIKERTVELQRAVPSAKDGVAEAQAKLERYQEHVRRLQEEVDSAQAYADAAKAEREQAAAALADKERSIVALQRARQLDLELDAEVDSALERFSAPLAELFDAYAGSLYAPEDDEQGEGRSGEAGLIDRAEMLHMLQDIDILGRGEAPVVLCGVFLGCEQTLDLADFKRCLARAALVLAPERSDAEDEGNASRQPPNKLLWLFGEIARRAQAATLPVLEMRRRVQVYHAARQLEKALE